MARTACPIGVSGEERIELERRVRARTSTQQGAQRAAIVLRAAAGATTAAMAAAVGVRSHTVNHWRPRVAADRLAGLRDRPHCPPPRRYGPPTQAAIVVVACQAPAARGGEGQTHWSVVDLAQDIKEHPELDRGAPSTRTIGRMTCVWTVFDSWMEERDPDVVPTAVEIIALELHPPTDGPTFCVDETTGIGVRTPPAPSHAVAPGQPARRAFEYVRHGTAAVRAAFAVQTGRVSGLVRHRHRHRSAECIELLRLLDAQVPPKEIIPLILAPLRMHCSAEVVVYGADRPWRFHFQWLPVHASWLSCIEAGFAILTKKCLTRCALADFSAADATITAFIATDNAHQAHPFAWKKGIRFSQRLKDKLAVAAPVLASYR